MKKIILFFLIFLIVHSKNLHYQHQQVVEQGSNRSSSIGNFIFGPLLFILSFPLIWYTEKKLAIDANILHHAQRICIQVNPFNPISNQIINKLVFMTGVTQTRKQIFDPIAGVHISNALKINRKVQVKQWRASKNNQNITYSLEWRSTHQSSAYGRINDASSWFLNNQTFYNDSVQLGNYSLAKSQIDQCSKNQIIIPNQQNVQSIMQNMPNIQRRPVLVGNYIYFTRSGNTEEQGATRIQFTYCSTGPISLMAKKTAENNSFDDFPITQYIQNETGKVQTSTQMPSCCCCLSNCIAECLKPLQKINLIQENQVSRHQLVDIAIKKTQCIGWVLRFLAFFCMFFGLFLFFTPITAILGYIPLLGGLVQSILNLAILLVSFLVCIPIYLIVFSIAWLFYHPKLGIPVVIVGVIIAVVLIVLAVKFPQTLNPNSHLFVKHI